MLGLNQGLLPLLTLAAVRQSNHSTRSHPQSIWSHPQSTRSHSQSAKYHPLWMRWWITKRCALDNVTFHKLIINKNPVSVTIHSISFIVAAQGAPPVSLTPHHTPGDYRQKLNTSYLRLFLSCRRKKNSSVSTADYAIMPGFITYILSATLLHLPSLRFLCVRGCGVNVGVVVTIALAVRCS